MTLTTVIGSSGSGKTTFLNDVVRNSSSATTTNNTNNMTKKCIYIRQYHNMRPYIIVTRIPNFDPSILPYWELYEKENVASTIKAGGTIAGQTITGLSGGQRKLLLFELICQRIIQQHQHQKLKQSSYLIVLDEPFAGVTDDYIPYIVERLNIIRKYHNILLVTNDHINALTQIADNTIQVSAINRSMVCINNNTNQTYHRDKVIASLCCSSSTSSSSSLHTPCREISGGNSDSDRYDVATKVVTSSTDNGDDVGCNIGCSNSNDIRCRNFKSNNNNNDLKFFIDVEIWNNKALYGIGIFTIMSFLLFWISFWNPSTTTNYTTDTITSDINKSPMTMNTITTDNTTNTNSITNNTKVSQIMTMMTTNGAMDSTAGTAAAPITTTPLILVGSSMIGFFCIFPYLISLVDWRNAMIEEAEALIHNSKNLNKMLKFLLTLSLLLIISAFEYGFVNAVINDKSMQPIKYYIAMLFDFISLTFPFIALGIYTNLPSEVVMIGGSLPFSLMIFFSTTFNPGCGIPVIKELRYLFPRFYFWCMLPGVQDFMEGCPATEEMNMIYLVLSSLIGIVIFTITYVGFKLRKRSTKKATMMKYANLMDDEFYYLQSTLLSNNGHEDNNTRQKQLCILSYERTASLVSSIEVSNHCIRADEEEEDVSGHHLFEC